MNCPVCDGPGSPCAVIDFNKTCEDHRQGPLFEEAGEPIEYHECADCGFVWAPAMCAWDAATYRERVYNADYARVDPEAALARPASNAAMLVQFAGSARGAFRHLDYGGGSGALSHMLRAHGFSSCSWDPFYGHLNGAPKGTFSFITAFEVAEHVPDPKCFRDDVLGRLARPGVVLFSTLVNDGCGEIGDWWYAAPRNGHVCLYSKRAIARLFDGFMVQHLSSGLHFVSAGVPAWLTPIAAG